MSSLSQSLAQSLAQSLSNSLIKSNALSFSKGAFTNATDRYMMIKNPGSGLWEMAGPFASGTLATKVVGGKRFGQFCSAKSTVNTYSEVFRPAISDWSSDAADVTDNATTSPISSLTADLFSETVATSSHRLIQSCNFDGSSKYYFICFVKPKERSKFEMVVTATAFPSTVITQYDIDAGTVHSAGTAEDYGVIALGNDWKMVYLSATSDAVASSDIRLYLMDDDWNASYEGDGSSGLYIWGANIIKANMLSPYIYAGAVTGDVDKDQFAWSEAVVNAHSWIRDGFKCTLSMSHATDEMLAADGGEHVIAAYDTTANGIIELYFDGADKKIKWRDDTTGALGESAALDWALGAQIELEWTLDNGSNSTLAVDGGGVDTTYNGTQTAAADGPLHYGMDDSQALQFDLGHISEPETL